MPSNPFHNLRNDNGQILVLTGMLIAPLLVFAAFATDVGAWVTTASRMQRSASAAALAGAAELPNVADATSAATEVMARNGFVSGTDSVVVSVLANPDSGVTVDIADGDPPMFFAGLVLPSLTINRRAEATSRPALTLGSPGSGLGNDPERGIVPNYWLATFGPNNTKENGDRFHTKICGSSLTPGCSGSSPIVNDEYDPKGHVFEAKVESNSTGADLKFQIFDPVDIATGITCSSSFLLAPGTAATNAIIQGDTELAASPPARYERGTSEWCVGDSSASSSYRLTVLVREPDQTPGNNFDNPVICAMEFERDTPSDQTNFVNKLASNATTTFPRWTDSGATLQSNPANLRFRDYFRAWVEICSVSNPQLGAYFIQIRTNADQSNTPSSLENADSSIASWGYNFYALRTGFGTDPTVPAWDNGLTLGARERLPIYINKAPNPAGGTITDFTLVRATQSFAGEQIAVDFYDISDGTGDITLEVEPSGTFAAGGGTITCSFTKNGAPKTEVSECVIFESAGSGNGKIYSALITLPATYDCDEWDSYDCWIRAKMTFSAQPHDVTTWSAYAPGKPVRLMG